jgi:DNA polymerase elongation subunit (family B)
LAKILILDIETAPNLAYVWRFFKENVGAKQVVEHSEIISYAYKWLGDPKVHYYDVQFTSEANILGPLMEVLDAADIVVAHNGNKFDLPTIQGRALVAGLKPPSPYKTVDTLLVARYEFNFPANSLEYLSTILGVSKKDAHKNFPGFELWSECLKGNSAAWEEMRTYNIQDVISLEEIYLKMRPWMRRHPNIGVFHDQTEITCPKCGGHHLQKRGFAHTNVGRYQRYQCNDCGGWSRSTSTVLPTELKKKLTVNVAN